ncbi:hypothetical protein ACFL5F_07590 [Planctomycetota bacterium]
MTIQINKLADVNIWIYDRLGKVVRQSKKSNVDSDGCKVVWDGRQNSGELAAGNVFLYVIEATTPSGEKIIYNRAPETGGLKVKPLEYTFDKNSGKISYVLPKACMVRLRAGLKDGMLAQTLIDWEPRKSGRHTLTWNGKDQSGLLNLRNHPELKLDLTCYRLPDNSIIVTGKTIPLTLPKTSNNSQQEGNQTKSSNPWSTTNKYLHYQHEPYHCHEPRFTVTFPNVSQQSENNIPIVSRITPIRVELAPQDARYIISKRFEVMLFIDGIYYFEMEEATSPYTFNWDTDGFNPGLHTLTVNVMSYDDHIGVKSLQVMIGE